MMLKRWSRNGWFLGCANYPKCKSTRDLGADGTPTQPRETGIACDKCGKPMVIRSGRFGEFLSCTGYPECKNAKPVPLGVKCPKCGGDIIEIRPKKRGGKTFYGCSNYADERIKCDFKLWQKPIPEALPELRRHIPRDRRDARQADDRVRQQGVRLQAARRRAGGERHGDPCFERSRRTRGRGGISVEDAAPRLVSLTTERHFPGVERRFAITERPVPASELRSSSSVARSAASF